MTEPHHEDALEPVSLIQQSGAILRVGKLMLAAGTASYRVKEAMAMVAKALGMTRHEQHVTLTEITTTSHRGPIFRTEVAEVREVAVNSDRISQLDQLRRKSAQLTSSAEVHAELDRIVKRGALYPEPLYAVFAGAACAGFAILNGARWAEVAVVFLASAIAQFWRRKLAHLRFNAFGTTLIAAAIACALYLAGMKIIAGFAASPDVHAAGYISAVLFLLPGFALITGALDIAKLDFSAGIQRIIYGTLLTLAAAVSVWAVSLAAALDTSERGLLAEAGSWYYVTVALASAAGVFGFALLFNSPVRVAGFAAVIGMVANVIRVSLYTETDMPVQAATTLACFVVGTLAAAAAAYMRSPIIILSVPAVLVMVPGVTAYQAVVSLNEGRTIDAVTGIMQVVLVVLAIVVGLVIAKLVTDPAWAREDKTVT